ncbi:MAG TPA: hypothetical protein VKS60_05480 [Stellaceae bacterium]|nr:hypothetical protein [Stellaceae bacterium]
MTEHPPSIFDSIERVPKIPGTRPGEAPEVRYVSFAPEDTPAHEYSRILEQVRPVSPKEGGACLDDCIITLPDGTMFFAMAFHADVEGWQRQIDGGARALGRIFAWIDGDNLAISDGRSIPLSSCALRLGPLVVNRRPIKVKRGLVPGITIEGY